MTPTDDIEACAESHERLLARVGALTDLSAPSTLPGWSLAHLLTHVARNADSMVRRVRAAMDGELVTQYAGGHEGRGAEIEHGAGRTADAVLDDLRGSCARVEELFGELPTEVWELEVLAGNGPDRVPVTRLPYTRWREVEIHHVDLGLGYGPEDWPTALVDRLLPDVVAGLASRTEPHQLLAWGLGRAEAPQLKSWG